ncbi:hypothetical protein NAH04_24230 [Serratia marcescens]|uniref:hypothetical protein n=1 Tax=Serratia marcescens TaxID=615 RepID=UPI001755D8BB|nr:hypothetical protein [Serratia marcescens]MCK1088708.1 hypothetical protein [Serratia marcescens]MCT4804467.1 hypothetical protein [Serratia marcescens]QLJ24770.1 hypothetical protein HZZ08_21955 [Serratia marcescens]QLJ26220.1 hypothetical protein HZZ07_04770 [Serratia marcescens]QLJ32849.1 hypothetical protein HZZ06_19810 [Serratia marcescens]
MHNSLSLDKNWLADWAKRLIVMADNNDLSSREIDAYAAKMIEQASKDDLAGAIKMLLNHIRMHK